MALSTSASIEMKLKELSCPFTWNMEDVVRKYKKAGVQHNSEIDDADQQSIGYLLLLLLRCYENTLENDMNAAELNLQEADKCFNEIKEVKPIEIDGIIRAIQHVLDATKCHFFYVKGMITKTEDILKSIVHTSDMTDKESGALSGCKSIAWTAFHNFGYKKAIEYATIAVEKNPKNPRWHFMLGLNLRRNRRYKSIFTVPGEIEKRSLEKAFLITKNPTYGIILAKLFREMSYKDQITISEKNDLLAKGLQICNEIFEMEHLSAFILLKLALDFMKRKEYSEKAKTCLDILKEQYPQDPMYLHYSALYMQRFEPYNKAEILQHLKAAGDLNNFAADIGYTEALCTYRSHAVAIEHLKNMLFRYRHYPVNNTQQITLTLATCYYFAKDYENAAENYLKAIEFAPKSPILNKFYRYAWFKTTSIYTFLKNEFLPMLQKECDIVKDDNIGKTYLKLKDLTEKNEGQPATSLEDAFKNIDV